MVPAESEREPVRMTEEHLTTLLAAIEVLRLEHCFFSEASELREIESNIQSQVEGRMVLVSPKEIIVRFGASLCEGCEGNGDLSIHGVDGVCGMCEGTGRISEELSRWLATPTEKGNG